MVTKACAKWETTISRCFYDDVCFDVKTTWKQKKKPPTFKCIVCAAGHGLGTTASMKLESNDFCNFRAENKFFSFQLPFYSGVFFVVALHYNKRAQIIGFKFILQRLYATYNPTYKNVQ